ncbi:MAG: glycosyltransferase family 4 protein [Bacteroidales bacterium]|nr:glycosyltransferase family 4 protein [Bacteroidales bacterium]
MKVLMFGWEFPPHITGGLGTASYGLCKGLLKQGVEVVFVVPKAYGDEDQSVAKIVNASDIEIDYRNTIYQTYWQNLTYIEVGSNLVPYMGFEDYLRLEDKSKAEDEDVGVDTFYKRKFAFSGKYESNLMNEVKQYAMVASTIAQEYNHDLIHAHDWLCYEAGIAAKAASGKPLVIHVHATEFDRSGENVNQVVYEIERRGMLAADRVMTVSNLTRQIVIERYGIDPKKVHTVYNAVEPIENKKQIVANKHFKEKVVTFLGRITFQKGPEYFVEAAHRVLQKDDNVRFVMAGSGDLLNRAVRRVAELGLGTKFHFTGFLKGLDVDRMFMMSDVYVMPSISEPFGISPLEAMRAGVPVVISNQSGCSEILHYALKVDFWDIDAMANSIYGLLHYDSLHKLFSEKGAEEVNNLKWENAALNNIKIYNKALNLN